MKKDFYSAVADRRSFYGIGKESVISDERIQEVVEHAVKYAPSAFNSQSTRVVLLLGHEHDMLWNITKEALRKIVPEDKFKPTEEKINSFQNGYGTVLFFEESSITKGLQEQFPLYKDNFPIWAQQSNGMNQYIIWTALEVEGFGVSLQHYNEIIEEQVKNQWNIESNWKLIAQMPFGKPTAEPDEKQYIPIEQRVRVFK
ncbi:putative oxidoreductase (fatty acid repression mutant protein) [Clostridium punense]|uniref:Oxidoreductase (Fatty acid repression mutant protein) n=1 Tax=Clostridium punense TaxID=1054297 RepID=A0ABS4K798_9CLOT|nr:MULTISPECIES: nitroreductase family protein [Clostridium]EQB87248.1 nitroreductase [Clostridium sp. BL8]MBP2023667.1 putative oxidoreductase (fatty acid repression mutant protein) [Clostridium punense]